MATSSQGIITESFNNMLSTNLGDRPSLPSPRTPSLEPQSRRCTFAIVGSVVSILLLNVSKFVHVCDLRSYPTNWLPKTKSATRSMTRPKPTLHPWPNSSRYSARHLQPGAPCTCVHSHLAHHAPTCSLAHLDINFSSIRHHARSNIFLVWTNLK